MSISKAFYSISDIAILYSFYKHTRPQDPVSKKVRALTRIFCHLPQLQKSKAMETNLNFTASGPFEAREATMAYTCQRPDPVSETWTFRSSAIAKRVMLALTARKMMQKELADLIGFRPQQISRILRGDVNLTMKTIAKIEVALGIRLLEVPSGNVDHVGHKRVVGPSGIRQKER